MKKFRVYIPVHASITAEVEAEDESEAIQKAYDYVDMPCLCNYCSGLIEIGDFGDDADAEEIGDGE